MCRKDQLHILQGCTQGGGGGGGSVLLARRTTILMACWIWIGVRKALKFRRKAFIFHIFPGRRACPRNRIPPSVWHKRFYKPKPPLSHAPRILSEQEEGLSRKKRDQKICFQRFKKKRLLLGEHFLMDGAETENGPKPLFFLRVTSRSQWSCIIDHVDRHTCSTCTKFRTSNTSYVLSIKKTMIFYHVY